MNSNQSVVKNEENAEKKAPDGNQVLNRNRNRTAKPIIEFEPSGANKTYGDN